MLVLPPDITTVLFPCRRADPLAWQYYGNTMTDILPALGTHYPMTEPEIQADVRRCAAGLFRRHDWRKGLVTLGRVPA